MARFAMVLWLIGESMGGIDGILISKSSEFNAMEKN
jgi:hypothetical protein